LMLVVKGVVSLFVSHFLANRSDKLISSVVENVQNILIHC
jgi:hypothetical protein